MSVGMVVTSVVRLALRPSHRQELFSLRIMPSSGLFPFAAVNKAAAGPSDTLRESGGEKIAENRHWMLSRIHV